MSEYNIVRTIRTKLKMIKDVRWYLKEMRKETGITKLLKIKVLEYKCRWLGRIKSDRY